MAVVISEKSFNNGCIEKVGQVMSAYSDIKDPRLDNDNIDTVNKYHAEIGKGTSFLCYRDLPELIRSHVVGDRALDLGCGKGASTKLLSGLGFDAWGVDVSDKMIELAKIANPDLNLMTVNMNDLPFESESFDLVLSTFVLLDIPSEKLLIEYLSEARRVLRPKGKFIACTASEYFHVNNWLTAEHDIQRNLLVNPGEMYQTKSLEIGATFFDVFHTHENICAALKASGLRVQRFHQPNGAPSDDMPWVTEWQIPPYSIYVCGVEKG